MLGLSLYVIVQRKIGVLCISLFVTDTSYCSLLYHV